MGSFGDLRSEMFAHYSEGEFQEALDLIRAFEPESRSQREDVLFWSMCLMSCLGDTDDALSTFSQGLEEGFWWSEPMLRDSDLDPLREDPRWSELVDESLGARDAAVDTADLEAIVVEPAAGPKQGVLVVLHGAGSRPELETNEWMAAPDAGWRLVAPRSSQRISSEGRFGWHHLDQAVTDVRTQLDATALSGKRVVVGGFSQGAGLAAHLVCRRILDAEGLVLVAPSLGSWPLPEISDGTPVQCHVLVGSQEPSRIREQTDLFTDRILVAGWQVETDHLEGVGHTYPDDFPPRLSSILSNFESSRS